MTIMLARFPGTCSATGVRFPRGATIDYDRVSRTARLVNESKTEEDGVNLAKVFNPAYVSNVFRTSGGTFYRNKRGTCEDAPACGCCTI